MDKKKVQVICKWPIPQQVKDIQSFLGFVNFYRRFIHSYLEIVTPLIQLTKKLMPWSWDQKCTKAFATLKEVFTTAPILIHWNPDASIIVETNVSDYVVAAILSTYVGTQIHPIAFYSRMLNAAELNYNVRDKELLAIYEAFHK